MKTTTRLDLAPIQVHSFRRLVKTRKGATVCTVLRKCYRHPWISNPGVRMRRSSEETRSNAAALAARSSSRNLRAKLAKRPKKLVSATKIWCKAHSPSAKWRAWRRALAWKKICSLVYRFLNKNAEDKKLRHETSTHSLPLATLATTSQISWSALLSLTKAHASGDSWTQSLKASSRRNAILFQGNKMFRCVIHSGNGEQNTNAASLDRCNARNKWKWTITTMNRARVSRKILSMTMRLLYVIANVKQRRKSMREVLERLLCRRRMFRANARLAILL
mmetsp:Transcript_8376/g.31153  ORF Transcript_8376/g.31153 Transcript_8376/m.31153 type:complete len:277 (+) Transcript_8376:913-1743(+)